MKYLSEMRLRITLLSCIAAMCIYEIIVIAVSSKASNNNTYLHTVTSGNENKRRMCIESQRTCSEIIPCTVWMLWDEGWHNAPKIQKMCLNSFKRNNPDWQLRAISLAEAEILINRSQHYSDEKWTKAKIQAQSDIIRIELLARYGGVWADSTVYCMEPLSNWIDATLGVANFFVYERFDGDVDIASEPWISSWFIASANSSRIVQIWRDKVRLTWQKKFPPEEYGYFWVHRIFRELVLSHTEFKLYYKYMTFMDAGGPHCWPDTLPLQLQNTTPYIYKIVSSGCTNQLQTLLEQEMQLTIT